MFSIKRVRERGGGRKEEGEGGEGGRKEVNGKEGKQER